MCSVVATGTNQQPISPAVETAARSMTARQLELGLQDAPRYIPDPDVIVCRGVRKQATVLRECTKATFFVEIIRPDVQQCFLLLIIRPRPPRDLAIDVCGQDGLVVRGKLPYEDLVRQRDVLEPQMWNRSVPEADLAVLATADQRLVIR